MFQVSGTTVGTGLAVGLPPEHRDLVDREYLGSILEIHLLERILAEFEVRTVFHLAALLSTRAEFTPLAGHQVNVEGTLKLLDFAQSFAVGLAVGINVDLGEIGAGVEKYEGQVGVEHDPRRADIANHVEIPALVRPACAEVPEDDHAIGDLRFFQVGGGDIGGRSEADHP